MERPIIPRTTSSMKMEVEDGTIRLVIDTTRLAYLPQESCYGNHRLAPDFSDKTTGLACPPCSVQAGRWLLDILFRDTPCLLNFGSCFAGSRGRAAHYLEPPRSCPAKRFSRWRFLTGLFIFEEGSRKMRRRGLTNTLIIKDIQIHCGDQNGTRIAFIRTVCPLKIEKNRTEAKPGAKCFREPRRIFQ